MCSASRLLVLALLAVSATAYAGKRAPLRVCADPNNLPFSDDHGRGFENKLAELVARDLGTTVEYTYMPQRRGFIRNTLKAKKCDLVIGVPAGYDMVATTSPYYRSGFVFVSRADKNLDIKSFDDPRLESLTIGVHAVGDDYSSIPPVKDIAANGLVDRVVGFSIYGDYAQKNPPARLIDAVIAGDIDIAVAWGPLAGYAARNAKTKLRITPVESSTPGMQWSIAMGARKDDTALRERVQAVLDRRRTAIHKLLAQYGVPLEETP